MLPDSAPVRTGVFISHAHEDEELAEDLRELLEQVLAVDRSQITCTSDPSYGLVRGSELDDQIRQRLNNAKALFLLATPHSRGKDWVAYECAYADQAQTKGDMRLYVLTPSASQLDSVPAPYRGRLAVTLSKAGDLHEFASQLRKTFGVTATETPPRFFEALLKLHARGDEAERHELTESTRQLKAEGDRFRRQRLVGLVAAAALAVALVATVLMQGSQRNALNAAHAQEIASLRDAHVKEIDKRILEMETERDDELRSLPFSGFFQDANNQLVPCVRVTANLFNPDGTPKPVPKECKSGRFTFGRELGLDPRERFTITADVQNDLRDFPIDRSTLPVVLVISGANR